VAKVAYLPPNHTMMVKGKINSPKTITGTSFLCENGHLPECLNVNELTFDSIDRNITIPITNHSEVLQKLKKRQILAEIRETEVYSERNELNVSGTVGDYVNQPLNTALTDQADVERLENMLKTYIEI